MLVGLLRRGVTPVKLKVTCPICHTDGILEIPEDAWDKVEGTTMIGRVISGKVCPHEFRVEFSKAGLVLGYRTENEPEEYDFRPVTFTVQTAIRNLGFDLLAAILTAGVSEQTIVLKGSLAVTAGIRDFMERVLPESVDVGACVYMATKEEYETLSSSIKEHMTVDVVSKKIINSAFDEDQLGWMRRVLTQANMVTDKEASEELVLKETSKLRTTVSLLRHLASRRGAGLEGKKLQNSE